MKTLIVGGVHGNELTGIHLAQHFLKNQAVGFDGLVCNPEAIKKRKRYLETDLNRSFGSKIPLSLEQNIAKKLQRKIKEYDTVLDFHNTKADGTTCAITVCSPNMWHLTVAHYFGFQRIVTMEPSGSLISLKPNSAISLEIANNDRIKFPEKTLIEKIKNVHAPVFSKKFDIEFYSYVTDVKRSTLKRVGIPSEDIVNFKELTIAQKEKLGLLKMDSLFPIFAKRNFPDELGFVLVQKYTPLSLGE